MEFVEILGRKTRSGAVALAATVSLALSLAGCGTIGEETLLLAGSDSAGGESVSTSVPVTEVAVTEVAVTEVAVTEVAVTEVAVTEVLVEVAAQVSTSPEVSVAGASDAVQVLAQVQDDPEELPRTGPNDTMLLIAIGCALIVFGRTMIDVVNATARALQRVPVRQRRAPRSAQRL